MDERLADMISRKWQTVALAITLAAISGQAAAHGWKPHHHRGWRHHGHSSGVWIGLGVGALLGSGFALSLGSGSRHGYGGSVVYSSPSYYAVQPVAAAAPAPAYEPGPVALSDGLAASPSGNEALSGPGRQQASSVQECRRHAINYSGFDPDYVTRWTTRVSIESYERALRTCLKDRGYGDH